ncbi:MAG: glycoside hydrolase family 3 N-terminal domain-containing protein [Gordonia sp. (in: high G+C Gram-positive bacteria)]
MDFSGSRRRRSARIASIAVAAAASVTMVAGCTSDSPKASEPTAVDSSTSSKAVSSSSVARSTSTSNICGGDLLAKMSLRRKLAQSLVVGVKNVDDARAVVRKEHIGGIFIGSWTDMSILSSGDAAKLSKSQTVPLMVTVDQEGGRVQRLSSLGLSMPSARQLVADGKTPDQVRTMVKAQGEKMRKLGITVDFAPVVDVSDEDDDEVIGDRSFSNDPEVVTKYAEAYAKGLQDAGIMPVFKHFPGHGHASGDTHLGGAHTPPLSQLMTSDLVPYRTLLKNPGDAGVMVGHLMVPGLTGQQTPASISPKAIGMLRTGAKYDAPPFDGVVFSDDLSGMKAIADKYPIDQAVLKALQAGSDIGLWLSTDKVTAVLNTLEGAVKSGKLSTERVDRSVVRILRAKGVLRC